MRKMKWWRKRQGREIRRRERWRKKRSRWKGGRRRGKKGKGQENKLKEEEVQEKKKKKEEDELKKKRKSFYCGIKKQRALIFHISCLERSHLIILNKLFFMFGTACVSVWIAKIGCKRIAYVEIKFRTCLR